MQKEFEKQVQEKMEELDLVPSPPVWEKIEEQIRQKKDRRRTILWLCLLFVIVSGSIFWLTTAGNENAPATKTAQQEIPLADKQTDQPTNKNIKENHTAEKTTNTENKKEYLPTEEKQTVSSGQLPGIKGTVAQKTSPQKTTPQKLFQQKIVQDKTPLQKNSQEKNSPSEFSSKTPDRSNNNNNDGKPVETTELISGDEKLPVGIDKKQPAVTPGTKQPASSKNPADTASNKKAPPVNAVVVNDNDKINIDKKDETIAITDHQQKTDSNANAVPDIVGIKQKNKKQRWEFGFSASGGVSAQSKGLKLGELFATQEKSALDIQSAPSTSFSFRVPYARNYAAPSPVHRSLSFSLAMIVKRPISKRMHIATGLQYDYYSTLLGSARVDSQFVVSNSATGSRQSFLAGTMLYNYTNKFHFLYVPFTLDFQVFKGIPFYVHSGLSVQQMVNTNAMEYNASKQAYEHDKALYNKTQVFSNLGFEYAVLNKKHELLIGPEMRYGLSKLESNNQTNHLFSVGMKAQFFFGKNR